MFGTSCRHPSLGQIAIHHHPLPSSGSYTLGIFPLSGDLARPKSATDNVQLLKGKYLELSRSYEFISASSIWKDNIIGMEWKDKIRSRIIGLSPKMVN